MKFRKQRILFVLFAGFVGSLSLFAQDKLPSSFYSYRFHLLDNGVQISVVNQGAGARVGEGHRVKLLMSGILADDTLFFDNFNSGKPLSVIIGANQLGAGLEEGLSQLNGGGEALFIIPPGTDDKVPGFNPGNPPETTVYFRIRVLDVTPRPVVVFPYRTAGLDTMVTKSGLTYIPVSPGNGYPPPKHAQVTVHYTLYLPDGKVVDSSVLKGEPFTFRLGEPGVIKGWNMAVALMSPGEKARFRIPWKLAYGKKGNPPAIPPKTNLIFDIELVKVEH